MSEVQEYTDITDDDAIEDNKCVSINVNGVDVIVIRSQGDLYCLEDRCSHAFSPLTGGRIRNGKIMCPLHGARFEIATGKHIGPQHYGTIASFPIRVRDGRVEVAVKAQPVS